MKVHYAGVCGSELARIIRDMAVKLDVPVPHGHEFAGVVEAVGSAVKSVNPGDRVEIASKTICGVCEYCLYDRVGQCANTRGFIGVKVHGGWAEDCKGDEINTVRLTDGVSTYAVPATHGLPDVILWDDKYLVDDDFTLVLGESLTGAMTV